jgi:hypothetical protein
MALGDTRSSKLRGRLGVKAMKPLCVSVRLWHKTTYQLSKHLPSIGQSEYLGALDTIYTANVVHPFSEPGGTSVKSWIYGFDPDGPGGAPFEFGAFGESNDDRSDSD